MRLLLLEDDEPVGRGLERMLKLFGHEVVLTVKVSEAQEALLAGAFDLVFLDIGLGGGHSGLELVRWMREHRPQTARVVMSGAVELRFPLQAPVERYLRKPFGRLELEAALAAAS